MLAVCVAALLSATGCAGRLFYFPDARVYDTPRRLHLAYEDVQFASTDGTRLHGWFLPAGGKPLGTVVHFHGNAQNLSAHFAYVSWLPEQGFNLFVFDYRGYGQSEGEPTHRGIYEDGLAALRYVQSRPDVDAARVLVLGQSLGGAVALAVLGREDVEGVRAVAVESAFYSRASIVRDKIALLPVLWLFKWPLSGLVVDNRGGAGTAVADISPVPVLFIHGTDDQVVPFHHAEWLHRRAREPKQLWAVDGAGHTEAFILHGETYRPALAYFFREALRDASGR